MERIYFDTETTGFKPGKICQIAYIIENEQFNPVEAKNFFFEIPESEYENAMKAAEVTGLTPEKLKELAKGTKFEDKATEIYNDFLERGHVAHNIDFDERFLDSELKQCGKKIVPKAKFDTMKIFTDICRLQNPKRAGFKFPKLQEVVDYYRLSSDKILKYTNKLFNYSDSNSIGYHDARYDVTCMYIICKVRAEELNGKSPQNSWTSTFSREIEL